MIQATDDWRIDADQYNIVVYKRGEQTNKDTKEKSEVWRVSAYVRTVGQALEHILQREVRAALSEQATDLRKLEETMLTAIRNLEIAGENKRSEIFEKQVTCGGTQI